MNFRLVKLENIFQTTKKILITILPQKITIKNPSTFPGPIKKAQTPSAILLRLEEDPLVPPDPPWTHPQFWMSVH